MIDRPIRTAVLALVLVAGAAGIPQAQMAAPSQHCVLAASPSEEALCNPQILTFTFEGAKAVDPMDVTAPHRSMVGSSSMMPFATTAGETTIAGRALDLDLDPVETGSIAGGPQ
jgi:hypothetical protein